MIKCSEPDNKLSLFHKRPQVMKGVLGAVITVLLILLDQLTKNAATKYLMEDGPIVLWEGVFELRYLENRGAAFGIMQNKQIFFIIMTIVVLLFLTYIYLKRIPSERRYIPMNVIAILLAAGAIGNLIDRLTLNYVVDFFYFKLIDFPIFNVADIYVTIAAALLIIFSLFYYKEDDFDRILAIKKAENAEETK